MDKTTFSAEGEGSNVTENVFVEFCGMNSTVFKANENFTHIKTLPCFSVVQSVSGSYDIQIDNGESFSTGSGGIFIAPPQYVQNITHNLVNGEMKARWVFFNMELNNHSAELLYDFPTIPSPNIAQVLNSLLDDIFLADNPFDKISLTYQIAKNVLVSAKEKNTAYNKSILGVLDYIKNNYSEKITVSDLAGLVHISESNLYGSFKKQMGMSPIAYLNDYRLVMASKFLKSTDSSIEEISLSVGIDDVRYFSKIFKRKYNMTPSAYRKNITI